eukprot:TRINITY_DN6656_c0_g1_i2.p1 TRINITY_DN6656_c0_g1~~TRINITY_DN6656_c0_g1_i2.p1  ORF type:complete len:186 (-),score=30.92 TRINITY_DN6656_c0_g1_i2:67-624(-)
MDEQGYSRIGQNWKTDKHGNPYDNDPKVVRELLTGRAGVTYLENECIVIEGIKLYGSPMTPLIVLPFLTPIPMAFNLMNEDERINCWRQIPDDTDVLLTHGPPKGICDSALPGWHIGDDELRARVFEVRPRFHVFGHVHQAYGAKTHIYPDGFSTTFLNAATCTMQQRPSHAPVVFDVPRPAVHA